jgi:trimeric autotransporter adhesin
VQYNTNVDGSVDYNNVTLGNNTGPTTIHNVAPGVAGTDAVNVDQLKGVQNSINGVARKAYAGVASAIAMESAPYVPGKVTYAAGAGYYQNQGAVGIALRRTADNGRWSVTGGMSASAGGVAARVGIAGVWN